TFFELAADGVTVWKVTVNGLPACATAATPNCTLTRVGYVQFNSNTYGSCSATAPSGGSDRVAAEILPSDYVQTWHGNFNSASDDTIGFTEGGAGLWHASTAYTYPDS